MEQKKGKIKIVNKRKESKLKLKKKIESMIMDIKN